MSDLKEETLNVVRVNEIDGRHAVKYSGVLSWRVLHTGRGSMDYVIEPLVPFRLRRIVWHPGADPFVDGRNARIKEISVGVMRNVAASYECDIPIEMLCACWHPMELSGIDKCLPGMRMRIRLDDVQDRPFAGLLIGLGDADFR